MEDWKDARLTARLTGRAGTGRKEERENEILTGYYWIKKDFANEMKQSPTAFRKAHDGLKEKNYMKKCHN